MAPLWSSTLRHLPFSCAMDHVQGRAFHHHLARAIMHLNYLAGLLPFFEPSIEFDDGPTNPPFHGESQSHRGLHTFVPLPVASAPPSLVSHGGLPTRLITNSEHNLRPITAYTSHRSNSVPSHPVHSATTACSPTVPPIMPIHSEPVMDPHPEPRPLSDIPKAPSRPTIPVPVRSKQRSRTADDPQPKKKIKTEDHPVSITPDLSRPENPHPPPMEEDDSDDSDSGDSHRVASIRTRSDKATTIPRPFQTCGKASPKPPQAIAKASPVAITSTVTLTPNPNEKIPSPDLNDGRRGSMTELPGAGAALLNRPWTAPDDAQLTAMKQDTRSRPSWKSIGARLERDPQLCKMRWALLKRADAEGRITAPAEPETED